MSARKQGSDGLHSKDISNVLEISTTAAYPPRLGSTWCRVLLSSRTGHAHQSGILVRVQERTSEIRTRHLPIAACLTLSEKLFSDALEICVGSSVRRIFQ